MNLWLKKYKIGIIFFIFCVVFRIIFAIPGIIDTERDFKLTSDSLEYKEFAEKILHSETLPDHLSIIRTPGYPLFLAFFLKLSGNRPSIVLIIQILLTSALILVVWGLSFISYKSKVIFSILYILNLNIALHSAQFLTDTLFMVVIFFGIISIIYYFNSPNIYKLLGISFIFAIAVYIRPIGLYFLPVLSIFLLFKVVPVQKGQTVRPGYLHFCIVLFSYLIFLSPWYIKNCVRFHSFFFSKVADISLCYFEAPAVLSAKEEVPLDSAVKVFHNEVIGMGDTTKITYYNNCSKVANKYLFKNFFVYSKIKIMVFLKTLFLPLPFIDMMVYFSGKSLSEVAAERDLKGGIHYEVTDLISRGKIIAGLSVVIKEKLSKFPVYILIISIFSIIYQLFILITAILSLRIRELDVKTKVLFLITVFYFTFLPSVAVHSRFRLPAEPYLMILSAISLGNLRYSLFSIFKVKSSIFVKKSS